MPAGESGRPTRGADMPLRGDQYDAPTGLELLGVGQGNVPGRQARQAPS